MADSRWVKAAPLGVRASVGAVSSVAVVALTVWAIQGAFATPDVPAVTLALLTLSFAVVVLVMAVESVASSLVQVDEAGYRTMLGGRRPWSEVLAIGSTVVEGARRPVVAVRSGAGFPVAEEVFSGFADEDADALIAAMRERAGDRPGFSGVGLPAELRAAIEAEAARVEAGVAEATGRRPVSKEWIEYGLPGLESAIELRFGANDAGEEVVYLVRQSSDLALEVDGVRYVRVTKKRSPDPVLQAPVVFGAHTTEKLPATELGYAQVVVTPGEGKKILFNAEEPDHYEF